MKGEQTDFNLSENYLYLILSVMIPPQKVTASVGARMTSTTPMSNNSYVSIPPIPWHGLAGVGDAPASLPILLVEDDPELASQLQLLLAQRGYPLCWCQDGATALTVALAQPFALILLDIRLPDLDGFQLLSLLRQKIPTPVMILSACGAEADRIQGFTHGADDYLAKPYSFTELLLRIEALLRRCRTSQQTDPAILQLQQPGQPSLVLQRTPAKAEFGEQPLALTPVEFKLLWLLLSQRPQLLAKRWLYPLVLERNFTEHDRSLDMHLSRLRKKLSAVGFDGDRIITVHGKGYRLL